MTVISKVFERCHIFEWSIGCSYITNLICILVSRQQHSFLCVYFNTRLSFFLIRIVGGGVQMGPLGMSATEWPILPAPGDYYDGEFGRMKIGRGNRSTRRIPPPAPLCPPQIPLEQARARTRAAAVGSQRLTAWAMARPSSLLTSSPIEVICSLYNTYIFPNKLTYVISIDHKLMFLIKFQSIPFRSESPDGAQIFTASSKLYRNK
jgi:hypothetical protein